MMADDKEIKTLVDIRYAVGDNGKRMQDELVEYIREIVAERDRLRERVSQIHKDHGCELRDPNGTIWEHAAKVEAELAALRVRLKKAPVVVAIRNNSTEAAVFARDLPVEWVGKHVALVVLND